MLIIYLILSKVPKLLNRWTIFTLTVPLPYGKSHSIVSMIKIIVYYKYWFTSYSFTLVRS